MAFRPNQAQGPIRGPGAKLKRTELGSPITPFSSQVADGPSQRLRIQGMQAGDVFQNLLLTTLAVSALVTRDPLYTPNRVYPTRQAEVFQNFQLPPYGAVATTPVVDVDYSRPLQITNRREDVYQQRIQYVAPFVTVDHSSSQKLIPRKDDVFQQFTTYAAPAAPFVDFDYSVPLKLNVGRDGLAGLNLQLLPPAPLPFAVMFDISRPLSQRKEDVLGSPYGLIQQIVSTPVAQSDLSARAQSIYMRVDGPLGTPLAITFPAPISVLPYFNFDATVPFKLKLNALALDVLPLNLQLFPPTVLPPTPTVVQEPAGRKVKKRLEVEIDGQVFEVLSVDEAVQLLQRARNLAESRAPLIASAVVEQKLKDKPPVNKPIRVPVPQIHTDDQELVEIVVKTRHAIAKLYREQAMVAEIRLRMQQEADDQDDEDLVLLL